MSKKAEAPPAPNYAPLLAASQQASQNVTNVDQGIMQQNAANAQADRQRYADTFQPQEDKLVADADSYASPERKQLEMGRSEAGVAQQFDAARDSATRDLESYGVNPGTTRFAALDLGTRVQQGAAQAAAGNQASQMVDATGRALRSEAINVGRGYPGQIAGTTNSALSAGAGAASASALPTQLQHTAFGDQIDAFKAKQSETSGIGTALGAAAGIGLAAAGMPNTSVGGQALNKMFAAEGGEVPTAASPTRGKAIDDVPAQLTPGEFVLPQDVTSWLGEEKIQKMIVKARQDKQGAAAQPTVRPASNQPPTFQSRPSALPVG